MKHLPNKKFIFFCCICLLIVGGGFHVSDSFFNDKNIEKKPVRDLIVKGKSSDDNSGNLNIQEVNNEFDPRIQEANNQENNDANQESLTDLFSKRFFSEYILSKQKTSGNLTQEDKKSLISYMLQGAQSLENKNGENLYNLNDIKISSKTDEKTIRDYGNNLALIIKKYFDSIPESELAVISSTFENGDEATLNKLDKISNAYSESAQEILLLEVPENFSESHLSLINDFGKIGTEIKEMKTFFSDPLRSLLAINQYRADAADAHKILVYINTYFTNNEVVFANNEPAKFFKVYLQ